MEVKVFVFTANYVIRFSDLKSEFQIGKSVVVKQVGTTIWLPYLAALSENLCVTQLIYRLVCLGNHQPGAD